MFVKIETQLVTQVSESMSRGKIFYHLVMRRCSQRISSPHELLYHVCSLFGETVTNIQRISESMDIIVRGNCICGMNIKF